MTKELNRQQQILAEITKELIISEEDLMGFGLHLGFTYWAIQQTRTNHSQSVEGAALHLACLWWENRLITEEEKVADLLEAVRAIGKVRLVGWVDEKLKRGIEEASVNVVGDRNQIEGMSEGIEQVQGASMNIAGGRDQVEGASVNVARGRDQVEGASVNAAGGRDQVEGASVNVAGGRDQVEGASMNVAGGRDQVEGASVNVAGGRDQGETEGASVMVVDEIEERHQAIVPVRERFMGSVNPTDV